MSDYELYRPKDVRAVIGACADTPTGRRDAAIVFMLWCTGLRCAEICDLGNDDIDRRRGTIWVASGKGGKSRTIVTPRESRSELWDRVNRWRNSRRRLAKRKSPLFCNLSGTRLDESYIRRMLSQRAEISGVESRFHPHGLRHTFAAAMHLSGVPLGVIQRQLGHSDLAITGAYLKRIGADVVHEIMEDFSLE